VIREGWGEALLWGAGVWSACLRGIFLEGIGVQRRGGAALAELGQRAEADDWLAEDTEDYARRRDGPEARRGSFARGRTGEKQNEQKRGLHTKQTEARFKKLHHHRLRSVYGEEGGARNPLVLLHGPRRLPMAQSVLFRPRVQDNTTTALALPTYHFA